MGDDVLAVLMPCHSQPEDGDLACLVAATFGLRTVEVDLGPTFDLLVAAIPDGMPDMARANIKPRLRMAVLYAMAQTRGYLVAGTGNKSELMVGYFTKYGDGGVDVEPLGELYKEQVRQLALELGIPQAIIDRPPSAGLWAGQTDEGEMGLTYEELDATLAAIEGQRTETVDQTVLEKVQRMIDSSHHKRATPPVCPIDSGAGS
jgi:NAD+ synthase